MQATGKTSFKVYNQSISVPFEYPVYFTRGLFEADNPLAAQVLNRLNENRRHRAAVYIDSGVNRAHPQLVARIAAYFQARSDALELAAMPTVVSGGEAAKIGWGQLRDVVDTIGRLHLDRQSYIIAIGGGSVLDMIGFATSIAHRGLRLIRIPTTTLAQNDAGVGVKNGMNENGQKNFIGTFAPPFAVLNDYDFLKTLEFEDWIGGVAEAFKVSMIRDAEFFGFLCRNAAELKSRHQALMEQVVYRCAVLHLEHIGSNGDPFEFGSARPLDFGHWAAHKIENMSEYAMGHGQAVAIGIALDTFYAMRLGFISRNEFDQVMDAFDACGLPTWHELLGRREADGTLEILEGLEQFREHLGGRQTITLPKGIGRMLEIHEIDPDVIEEAVSWLRQRQPVRAGRAGGL